MNFKKLLHVMFSAILFCSLSFAQSNSFNNELKGLFKNLPFKMKPLTVPNFPDKNFPITDFGAVGDGLTMNTEAFSKAIDECSKKGGGKVIVPAGIWLTGPILLKDNVNLHLKPGAHIQFSKNFDDYPVIESNWEGVNQFRCTSPLMARNAKNIAITGNGVIDGSGEVWRYVKKFKLTDIQWEELVRSGGVLDASGSNWWPTAEARDALSYMAKLRKEKKPVTKEDAEKYKVFFRPVLLNFIECKNVWLDEVTFQNSPAWNLHPLLCENVIVTNVTVRNPWYSQNGDGIDVESCKNVLIYKSKFDVGDDAICMKSGKDKEGRDRGVPSENILIKDCIVYHGHGGFTIGSEMSGGVRNIKVDNCNFIGTDVGLRFKSTRGRGGVVENIYISNIFMKDIPTDALSFNMYYGGAAPTEDVSAEEKSKNSKAVEVTEETPRFKKIYLENIVCTRAKDAIVLQGLPEMPIQDIEIKNVNMTAERGVSMFDADGIKITNSFINCASPVVRIIQGKNITLDKLESKTIPDTFLRVAGDKSSNVVIKGLGKEILKDKIQLGDGVQENTVKIE